MNPVVIKTSRVSKIYHETKVPVTALDEVDLEVRAGEFTAIVGPSGSGKSTLLNIIGGLDAPTAGEVMVGGHHLHQLSDRELIDFRLHHIGFVFQAYNLIPVLTARENIEFIMLLQQVPAARRRARAGQLLEEVGLADRQHNRPAELSGGQQQRVAVARALASRPDFILADEPTANLDSKSAENLLAMMADLNRQEQATFIFSTHDQRVIDKARRVITLEDGRIVSDRSKP
jgi:putative ABC transport system ATP-binding protein